MIKKIIAYPLTHLFYYLGHWVCVISYRKNKEGKFIGDETQYFRWFYTFLARSYQANMSRSTKIQDWGGLNKPWQKVNK